MRRYRVPLLVLSCLVATAALAATLSVRWTNATQNTDNTAIPATGAGSIATTRVEWSQCGPGDTFGTKVGETSVLGTVTQTTTPDLPPGHWCLRAIHVNTFGVESDPSNVAVKDIAAPKPRPPANFSIS